MKTHFNAWDFFGSFILTVIFSWENVSSHSIHIQTLFPSEKITKKSVQKIQYFTNIEFCI